MDATLAKLTSIGLKLERKHYHTMSCVLDCPANTITPAVREPKTKGFESAECPKCGTRCHPKDLDGPEVTYERMSAFTPEDEDEPIFYRKQVRHSVCGACIAEMSGLPYTSERPDTSRRLRK